MNEYVLNKLLKIAKDNDYYVVYSYNSYYDNIHQEERINKKLYYIAFPDNLKTILKGKNLHNITYQEVKQIKEYYIDTNIILNSECNPFQLWQQPFYYAVDIEWVDDLDFSDIQKITDFSQLISLRLKN